MANGKTKVIEALVDEETYTAFVNGDAVSNNGLRAQKGSFWPSQPDFRLQNERAEKAKDYLLEVGLTAVTYITFQVVLPSIKRVTEEKIVPFVEDKIDEMREKHRLKKAAKINAAEETQMLERNTEPSGETESKIIYFDSYRKEA